MKQIKIFAFSFLASILLYNCHSKPNEHTLQQLVRLTAAFPETDFCVGSTGYNPASAEISSLLSKTGFDCCRLYYKSVDAQEDSVLILTKRKFLEEQSLYYDFSTNIRELKVWDYPAASDKRVKIGKRLYLQTVGFD